MQSYVNRSPRSALSGLVVFAIALSAHCGSSDSPAGPVDGAGGAAGASGGGGAVAAGSGGSSGSSATGGAGVAAGGASGDPSGGTAGVAGGTGGAAPAGGSSGTALGGGGTADAASGGAAGTGGSTARDAQASDAARDAADATTDGGAPSDGSDVVGKVTVGYQGWFTAPGDGSPQNAWGHNNYECWPDVREYAATYQTPFGSLGNDQPATFFSSWDASTVNKHFEWMKTYGIDTAALQRFANEITPGSAIKRFRDGIATRVRSAAETHDRKFYVMYDVSGWGNLDAVKADWTDTITSKVALDLLSSPAYARQNGKPVVSVYGLGYASHPSNVTQALDLITWLKSQGLYVIGSVPGQWRTGTGDSKAGFIEAYKALNMISGWCVGRAVDGGYAGWVTGDRDFCAANNMDYQPCAYPGTSFFNTNGASSPKNQFPRNHGDFLWSQFSNFRSAGVKSVYVAMFDEVNEATQIFKTAENAQQIPAGRWYLTLDADGVAVSSDFYLRLTGDGGRMLKGLIPLQTQHPTTHMP
jgi:hypothetical protein